MGDGALKPLLHDPRWTEIILLAAGRLGELSRYQATRFVKAILSAGSPHERLLHRDLLLAVRCLTDDVRVDAPLRQPIVSRLERTLLSAVSPPALLGDVARVMRRGEGTGFLNDVLRRLAGSLSSEKVSVRERAAEALGQIGEPAATPQILSALLGLLADDAKEVRKGASGAIKDLSAHVQAPDRPGFLEQVVSLAGRRDPIVRDMVYVCLRDLLAAEAQAPEPSRS